MEKVCVVLSTYNGQNYLDEQIRSLLAQKNVDLTVLVRDDGSSDQTQDLLRQWNEKEASIQICEKDFGVNFGVAKSFIFLLNYAERMFPDIQYFFFCDQDDVWKDAKCFRAVQGLTKYRDRAALYFSRKKLVDGKLNPLDREDIIRLHGDFWDYFDRSNAFGCTMCLTRPLAELLHDDRFYKKSFLHDNYIYRLCLAAGIPIIYDDAETILYRQHGANVAGAAKRNVLRGIKRLFKFDRVHVVREMSEYLIAKHDSVLNSNYKRIIRLYLDSYKSWKSKLKLMNMYQKQRNRTMREKLLFDVSILLNYF